MRLMERYRRMLRCVTAVAVAALLIGGADAQAQSRNNNNGGHRTSSTTTSGRGGSTRGGQVSNRKQQAATNATASQLAKPKGGNRPNGGNRPGNGNVGNGNRPGGGGYNPGGNRPGGRPGHSVPAPGTGSRPNYGRPTPPPPAHAWRPPMRPRWERPLPPPPPRYNYVRIGAPSISAVLGLTFGSLFDYGINTLYNTGYNIVSAIDNAIYLSNVSQFGILWPEATVYYNNGIMTGARFQYGSYSPTDYRWRTAYSQLCSLYGNPVEMVYNNGCPTATWWGGNNTGYITLTYGPGVNQAGSRMYYTDLIYGN